MQPDQSVRSKVDEDVVGRVIVGAPERAKARLVLVDATLQCAVDVGQLAVRKELNGGRSRKRWNWNEIGHGGKLKFIVVGAERDVLIKSSAATVDSSGS